VTECKTKQAKRPKKVTTKEVKKWSGNVI
jgi:hypothetical protein